MQVKKKLLKGITTIVKREVIWRKITGLRKSLRRAMPPLPIRRKIVTRNKKLKHQSPLRKWR